MPRASTRSHRKRGSAHKHAEPRDPDRPRVRPFWSGTLSFGLVSIPVELYPAQRPSSHVSLRMLGPDGTPLARRYVCSAEQKLLSGDDLVRGYELDSGEHVVVTDEELEALDPKKTRDIDLRRFVDRSELDPLYFERAYFLAPGAEASKAYRLLADVMERKKRAGIATFVLRDRERVLAIFAQDGLLRGQTLHFDDEVRSAKDVGLPEAKKKAPRQLTQRMLTAIEALAQDALEPEELADASRQKLSEIARKKQKSGKDVLHTGAKVAKPDADVIDLMAVLKRSLREETGHGTEKPARRAKRAKS